jgi:hypothetical protein
VRHACDPSYSGGREQEDRRLKPAWANSSQDPISKNTTQKRAGRMTPAIECQPSKHEALSSNPRTTKKNQ